MSGVLVKGMVLRGEAGRGEREEEMDKISPYCLQICFAGKFTARLTTMTFPSAGLLTAPSSFAMQSALLWETKVIRYLRWSAPCPNSTA